MQELTLAQAYDFFENHLEKLMWELPPDLRPLWGQMTPQHAVEHLNWIWGASNGKENFPVKTPADQLPRYRRFLFINMAMDPGVKSPIMDPDTLPPLKHLDFETAVEVFFQEWKDFETYYREHPGAKTNNAVFGPLTGDEWRLFHFKHIVHHLAQFGVTTVEAHGLEYRVRQ
ncbi:MAG: DUF1569 domain-containing protein [Lewinellaceae bacterium]|nr:DUF1569 domain-containing protein [Saprospiraceae bacterium]MCB9338098.1 DUF1569 domain-containing protein [Lewinellaceae bacterium]